MKRGDGIAVLCPHPDDEAIFCGGTIRALADAGHRVVIIAATSGDAAGGAPDPALRELRRRELEVAGEILGATVHHLGHVDSGVGPVSPPEAFVHVPVERAAAELVAILEAEGAGTLVADGPEGIYGHPDHIHAHDVAARAAALAGIPTRYEVTVDREHLHFVDVHVVQSATAAVTESWHGHSGTYGHATVEIDLVVDVSAHIAAKRAAFAAHASQLPEHSETMRLGADAFAAVYGIEWFNRVGPDGVLDELVRTGPAG